MSHSCPTLRHETKKMPQPFLLVENTLFANALIASNCVHTCRLVFAEERSIFNKKRKEKKNDYFIIIISCERLFSIILFNVCVRTAMQKLQRRLLVSCTLIFFFDHSWITSISFPSSLNNANSTNSMD